jgi:hypothetical protein
MMFSLQRNRDRIDLATSRPLAPVAPAFSRRGGIDRIAMLKYGIPDLRAFFESDLRWLRHYGFAALDVPDLARGLSR